jgi:hypothetical protein
MSKIYTGNYVVRWFDKNDKENRKVYSDYKLAIKAKNWLISQGLDNIDIAVERKPITS